MAAAPFVERHYTSQDGLRLYYREYGAEHAAATPVICLPGLTRNSKDFEPVAMRLSRTRRVLSPDYRGRGRSAHDPDWRHYEPRTYLNDLRHLLAAAGVGRVVMLGTSMGALLSMGMAVGAPMALAGVILNDAGPELDPSGLGRILDYIGTDRPQADWDEAVTTLKSMFPNLSIATEDGWRDLARGTFREGDDGRLHYDWDTNIAKALVHGPPTPDLWPVFRALRGVPVLAFRGALSDVLSADTFARMRRELPDITAVTIAGVGHTPTLSEPESEAAIDEFLARIP